MEYVFSLCCLVALVGSGLAYEGRLEVLYDGVWGTVCATDFSDDDAAVFCNQLGLGYVDVTFCYLLVGAAAVGI